MTDDIWVRWHVKEWLEYIGLPQAHIVAETGYTKSEVSEWVNHERRWNAEVLHRFAKAMSGKYPPLAKDPSLLINPPTYQRSEVAEYFMAMEPSSAYRWMRAAKAHEAAAEPPANPAQKSKRKKR